MPAVKSVEQLEKAFHEAATKFKAAVEADGVSVVTIMATPGKPVAGEIALTDHVPSDWPALKAVLTAAQEWRKALDPDGDGLGNGLRVIVIVRKGSLETTVINTKESA